MENLDQKTTFKINVTEKQAEFDILLEKFNSIVDPIERYIKRLEMTKLQNLLSKHEIHVSVP
ncbi:MAG: hypothetical protein ACTSYI_11920 [Promethearchaeota archaeon]